MKIPNGMRSLVGALTLSICSTAAHAVPVVSIDPATTFGSVGDTLFVDILWNGDGQYIGDWDVDISYDNSVVSYVGSDFHFGVDSWGCFICGDDSIPGTIDLFEVSFDTIADLIANQDSLGRTFKLATMEFEAIADGISPLLFGDTVFGNEFGQAISPQLANGRICVGNADCSVSVPEPTTLALFLLGLAGLALRRPLRQRGS